MPDAEVIELTSRVCHLHELGINSDGLTTRRAQFEGLPNLGLFALEHRLDAAVWHVPHPTCQPERVGALLRAGSEENPLDAAFEDGAGADLHRPGMDRGTEKTFPQNGAFSSVIGGKSTLPKRFILTGRFNLCAYAREGCTLSESKELAPPRPQKGDPK